MVMEILHLIKKVSILTAVPILLILALAGLLKLLTPLLQKLSDKSFQVVDKYHPRPIGRYGRLAYGSFKIMIGYIIFTVFFQMFSLPMFFIPAFKSEPPVIIMILLNIAAVVFSGIITYKLMRIVNKNFNPPGNQHYND